jgi:hypothetical protein
LPENEWCEHGLQCGVRATASRFVEERAKRAVSVSAKAILPGMNGSLAGHLPGFGGAGHAVAYSMRFQ